MIRYKIKVRDKEHSAQVQTELIGRGYFWPGDVNTVFDIDGKYIYTDEYGSISWGNSDSHYEDYDGEELE